MCFYVVKQISTQQEDYLIDTVALHDSMEILRPVFADPSICKVCNLSLSCFFQGEWGGGDGSDFEIVFFKPNFF
jgi:hypothetical protein